MTPDTTRSTTGKLMITQESVLRIVKLIYELHGLGVAMAKFEEMNAFFSTEPGWAESSVEIYKYFAEKRKEEKRQSREEKMEELRISAPKIIMANTNKAIGAADIDKMDVEVKSPGNNIARIIKIGDNEDEK